MTDEQKRQIAKLRIEGLGYKAIAERLGLSINSVKSYCKRHQLEVGEIAGSLCENCGKPIHQVPGRKRKRFCCDKCRMEWWNSHQELVKHKTDHTYVCAHCGKEFHIYGGRPRKYCSPACYFQHRFGGSHG